jgi:hypothetical protein
VAVEPAPALAYVRSRSEARSLRTEKTAKTAKEGRLPYAAAAGRILTGSWASGSPESDSGILSGTLALRIQKVCELRDFSGRRSQRLGGVISHGWHNLVVQVCDQFRSLFFQRLGNIRYRAIETRGNVLHLAVEFRHTHPAISVLSSRVCRGYRSLAYYGCRDGWGQPGLVGAGYIPCGRRRVQLPYKPRPGTRYNHAMLLRLMRTTLKRAVEALTVSLMSVPVFRLVVVPLVVLAVLSFTAACTFYGDRPARAFSDATGGEGLERVFWKEVQTGNWVEIERALASNYAGVTSSGTVDRSAALDQYRSWQLKEYAIGDLKTELNGTTIVVTYTISLNGTVGSQPLPSVPQRMMTVWQQQKKGWMVIAHSVSPQQ